MTVVVEPLAGGAVRRVRPASNLEAAKRALLRTPSRVLGTAIIAGFVFMAVAGPFFYPSHLPVNAAEIYAPPSWAHPLGTDFEGTDVLALLVVGARYVLVSAAVAGAIAVAVGVVAGLAAGYLRGFTDSVLSRLVSVVGAIYAETGLFFLGVLPAVVSNWGVMLNLAVFQAGAIGSAQAVSYLLSPLVAILLLTLGVVLVLDAVDEFFNPRLRD